MVEVDEGRLCVGEISKKCILWVYVGYISVDPGLDNNMFQWDGKSYPFKM